MKANRKFLNGDDDAVSPVIAVILMVAITVVLAATVYVWVSGFGGSGQASKSIALSSNGPISSNIKTYAIASATSGMKWSDLDFTLDGTALTLDADCTPDADNEYSACAATTLEADSATVDAGDFFKLYHSGGLSGKTLRVLDANANSVLVTQVIG